MHYYLFQVDMRGEDHVPDPVLSTTDREIAYKALAIEKEQASPVFNFVIREVPDRVHDVCIERVKAQCPH